MKIESPAFAPNDHIPITYSRLGDNRSPPLVFHDVPSTAKTLALIVDDPDAPRGTFTHWIIYDLPVSTRSLPEAAVIARSHVGRNDWDEAAYGGPRPPDGEHRYFFRLYALDSTLALPPEAKRQAVDRALRGHIVAEAELVGRFATPVQAERDGV